MKCVDSYKTDLIAGEKRRILAENGIESRIVVDPLESRYPALSTFSDVALMVSDEDLTVARGILAAPLRKAS
jgi:hypothetical protein